MNWIWCSRIRSVIELESQMLVISETLGITLLSWRWVNWGPEMMCLSPTPVLAIANCSPWLVLLPGHTTGLEFPASLAAVGGHMAPANRMWDGMCATFRLAQDNLLCPGFIFVPLCWLTAVNQLDCTSVLPLCSSSPQCLVMLLSLTLAEKFTPATCPLRIYF